MKTVLITGATSGLGRAVTLELLRCGHRVIATGKDTEKLAALRRLVGSWSIGPDGLAYTGRLVTHPLNVAFTNDFPPLRRGLVDNELTSIDALFVNAGVMLERADMYEGVTPEKWPNESIYTRTFAVNVCGARRTVEALESFVTFGGRVIFTGGIAGSLDWQENDRAAPMFYHPAYSASKAALNMEMLHLHRRSPHMFVASLHPGWLETAIGGAGTSKMRPRKVESAVPFVMKYLVGEPEASHNGKFVGPDGKIIAW